jgi:predicted Rossmann fold flavoprotein
MNAGDKKVWDVIVVGGGAAGMMAAATAAAHGAETMLVEKNTSLGKKLRITGGGRCNVTNNKPDNREMLDQYKGRGKFLFSTFSQHGVADTVSWLRARGVTLKEENEGRLFPVTDSADTIYEALASELARTGVTVISNSPATRIEKQPTGIFRVETAAQGTYTGKHCILATGGLSRPETGSTGDGFTFAKRLGHTITEHDMALVPVATKERWVRKVSGTTISDITITVLVDGERKEKQTGKLLFTHTGVSGPTILNLSKRIGEWLQSGTVTLGLDFVPHADHGAVREQLTNLFQEHSNKRVRNVLSEIVPSGLGRVLLEQTGIDGDTPCHSVRVEEKKALVENLKHLTLTVSGLLGTDKAVISSGGVKLEEIDFKTMESKKISGLFLVGDMLDIDRPSGGYSLQLCWSTGYVAGLHAAAN